MSENTDHRDVLLCESIEYSKGAIEVCNDIHPDHINLEAWMVYSETDLGNRTKGYFNLEGETRASVELELTRENALDLIKRLQTAVNKLERGLVK